MDADHKASLLLVKLLTALIHDAGKQFYLKQRDLDQDIVTIQHRMSHEGLSFATKTLPAFGKHLDKCLQKGRFTALPSFRRQSTGPLPCFLKGLTKHIFATDGTLTDNPDVDAIRLVRQIAFTFYKLEGDYPKELVDEKIKQLLETDAMLDTSPEIPVSQLYVWTIAQALWARVFKSFDTSDIIPHPGPGATADSVANWNRFEPHVLYEDVHTVYPYYSYFYCNSAHLSARTTHYRSLPRVRAGYSKLLGVPKDSRGPRLICEFPHEYMWFQQGLGGSMMRWLESHELTSGHVNFTDQTVNQQLALAASENGLYDTLDMKEASDRISKQHVSKISDRTPELQAKLLALTVDTLLTPDGTTHTISMYAPMGSALCFPIMSVVHYLLAVAAIVATGQRLDTARRAVYVYGDDLIIRHQYSDCVIAFFEEIGLKFNLDKCCREGKFRESCGMDAYNGHPIAPVRIKKLRITSSKDAKTLPALLDYHNSLWYRGLWKTANVLREHIEQGYGNLPYVSSASAAVGWVIPSHLLDSANKERVKIPKNKNKHPYINCRTIVTKKYCSMIDAEGLLRWHVYHSDAYASKECRDKSIIGISYKACAQPIVDDHSIYCSLARDTSHLEVDVRDHTKITWARVPTYRL